MLSETKIQDTERKKCHHYIRIFKHKVMQQRVNNSKQTITVQDIRDEINDDERLKIIKRLGIKQSDDYIDNLVNHVCNCSVKSCFINYGKSEKVTATQLRRQNITY